MPRKGFKSLTLPEGLYQKLLRAAELYGTTPQNVIKIALSDGKIHHQPPGALVIPGSNPGGPTTNTSGTFLLMLLPFPEQFNFFKVADKFESGFY